MKKVIIRGSAKEIDRNINFILALCKQSGNSVGIIGIICEDREYASIDGIPCVSKDFDDYDYVIVLNDTSKEKNIIGKRIKENIIVPMKKVFSLILSIRKKNWTKANSLIDGIYENNAVLQSQDVADNRIISSEILHIPGFDFQRYLKLRQEGVSIISNNCWGGLAYNYLGFTINSPFINMWILPGDYMRLINNLEYYLSQKLRIVDSAYDKGKKKWFPIVALGDVKMAWNHCFTYNQLESSVKQFIRRCKRVNYNRLLAFVYFEGEGMAKKYEDEFETAPIEHKFGMSYDYEGKNIYLARDYIKDRTLYNFDFFKYVNSTVERGNSATIRPFNLLKLLNLEDDFLRI